MWQAQVFTLYPEVFPGPLSKGLYGKALSKELWNLKVVNIRDAAEDKHKTVDDTPYGGGSGMLLKADTLAKSLDQNKIEGDRIIYLSPKAKNLINCMLKNYQKKNLYLLFVVILKELMKEFYLQEI
jgi:tRNA (guanine37-N1)-methyltransferase